MKTTRCYFCANSYAVLDALMCGRFRPFALRTNQIEEYSSYDLSGFCDDRLILHKTPCVGINVCGGKRRPDVLPMVAELEIPLSYFNFTAFDLSLSAIPESDGGELRDKWSFIIVDGFIPAGFIKRLLFKSERSKESFAYSRTSNVPLPELDLMECQPDMPESDITHLQALAGIEAKFMSISSSRDRLLNMATGCLTKLINLCSRNPWRFHPAEIVSGFDSIILGIDCHEANVKHDRDTYDRIKPLIEAKTYSRLSMLSATLAAVDEDGDLFKVLDRLENCHRDPIDNLCWLCAAKAAASTDESIEDRKLLFDGLLKELNRQDDLAKWKSRGEFSHDIEPLRSAFKLASQILASREERTAIENIPKKYSSIRAWLLYCLEGDISRIADAAIEMPSGFVQDHELIDAVLLGAIRHGYSSLPYEYKQGQFIQSVVLDLCMAKPNAPEREAGKIIHTVKDRITESDTAITSHVSITGPWSRPWELDVVDHLEDCWKKALADKGYDDDVAIELATLLGWDDACELHVEMESEKIVMVIRRLVDRLLHIYPGSTRCSRRLSRARFSEILAKSAESVDWKKIPLSIKLKLAGITISPSGSTSHSARSNMEPSSPQNIEARQGVDQKKKTSKRKNTKNKEPAKTETSGELFTEGNI